MHTQAWREFWLKRMHMSTMRRDTNEGNMKIEWVAHNILHSVL